jgi:HTH-type transcriptional regulator, competence development regulator
MLTKYVDKITANNKRRSSRSIMTHEARVLKELRLSHGFSMRKAAELIGLSDSYIAHIETGRMDPPTGIKLDRMLKIYGNLKQKTFYEYVRNFKKKISHREELQEIIDRMKEDKITIVLNIVRGLNI